MAIKTYTCVCTVTVENEDGPVKISKRALMTALGNCVNLTLDTDNSENIIGDNNVISAMQIDYSTVQEK